MPPKKLRVAFGSSVPRFGTMVQHPSLDPQGLFRPRPQGCNPCLYRPIPMKDAYGNINKKAISKDPWRYKSELEDWSKNLGYRNQHILDDKKWFDSLLGPAWTEVPPELKCQPAVCKNVLFGRTSRFKKSRVCTPGPGTYYNAIPYKAPYGPHSTRPTLEREEPCRFPDRVARWSLAPNRYSIPDPDSIENKPKKIISLRGPYELFTGKRDGSTIKNHFSTSQKTSSKSWPLAMPGSFEGLKIKHFGEWNKTGRDKPPRNRVAMTDLALIPRKSEEPSAATYNLRGDYEFPQYKYGFNSSYDKEPGYKKTIVWPGVGRYNIFNEHICGLPGHGHRHVFLCKIQRTIGSYLPEAMNSF